MKTSAVALLVFVLLLNVVQFASVSEGAVIQERAASGRPYVTLCHFKICNMGRPRKPKSSSSQSVVFHSHVFCTSLTGAEIMLAEHQNKGLSCIITIHYTTCIPVFRAIWLLSGLDGWR
ncbi:hypothetical protein AVEN_57297-1 [Araneus ventricosus]|uniref:Uncharacterized protein n=1 Tax=Araneus ventricosus TaxID=182803 RepID=A0A4Y2IT96_ARAVE|nr:hypothetical protein AVEN_57297-1 [Araneus ventricosus]